MMYIVIMFLFFEKIVKKYLCCLVIVIIGIVGEVVEIVEQCVEFVCGEDCCKKCLQEILVFGEFGLLIIVFVNIKWNCDVVVCDIKYMGWFVVILYGLKMQEQCEVVL